MDVLCVGMYRAGSTWQYAIAADLIERHRDGQRLGFVQGPDYQLNPSTSWRVLKSHDFHSNFAAALQEGRALALYCWRDLRDVCFSLMHKMALPFDQMVVEWLPRCLNNDRAWRAQPGVLGQCYENLTADPAAAVKAITDHLHVQLEDGEAQALAEKYSLPANRQRAEAYASELTGQGVDLRDPANAVRWQADSLLHWNHIRSGAIGDWRRHATARQRAQLAQVCGDWLVEMAYERDLTWAARFPRFAQALKRLRRTPFQAFLP